MSHKALRYFRQQIVSSRRLSILSSTRSLSNDNSGGQWKNNNKEKLKFFNWKFATVTSGSVLLGYCIYKYQSEVKQYIPTVTTSVAEAKSEPVFSSSEVAKHSSKGTGIWVSYKDSVYDITDFVDAHPGGDKIMLGAGGPIDAFWGMYAVHQTPEVLEILSGYKIGKLKLEDRVKVDVNDPFVDEPNRVPVFRVNSSKPFNAEPPLDVLTDFFITPNDLFYVRNHLPVPKIDPKKYRLDVEIDGRTLSLSLDDLKRKYKPVTITTTIQCAGNRRAEMSDFKKVKGLTWGTCAIGTARWTGVRLRDVLKDAGFDINDKRFKHIHFNGQDSDMTKSCYGASIPKRKAMSEDGDVILAYKMNGVDVPRDHGYPIRAIVPGYVGARNVKWLHHVTASDEESRSHWQRHDYKGFSPSTTPETADYSKAQSIQEMPVVSVISSPTANMTVDPFDGTVEVKGYAWSGGGRDIIRVDVSADGGKTWKEAEMTKDEPNSDDSSQCWAWTLWKVDIPVEEGKQHEIVCKAIDSSYNAQPENVAPIWNLRGFLTNSWHRVPVNVSSEQE